MTVTFRSRNISEVDVLKAMLKFRREFADSNDYQNWLNNQKHTYAVVYEDYLYPPKYLLKLITGMKTTEFKGADKIRSTFDQLGFVTKQLR